MLTNWTELLYVILRHLPEILPREGVGPTIFIAKIDILDQRNANAIPFLSNYEMG